MNKPYLRKKKRSDSVYNKSLYRNCKVQEVTGQHKHATKNFDYTTIADRLMTVSWRNDSHKLVRLNRLTVSQPSR